MTMALEFRATRAEPLTPGAHSRTSNDSETIPDESAARIDLRENNASAPNPRDDIILDGLKLTARN